MYPFIDGVVSDIAVQGGIDGTMDLLIMAGLNRRFWVRSAWELGVAWVAMCHLGMARPDLSVAHQLGG